MPVDGCIVHSLPRIENINPAASLIVGCGGCFFVAFPGVPEVVLGRVGRWYRCPLFQ